jgi:hypothetical protein
MEDKDNEVAENDDDDEEDEEDGDEEDKDEQQPAKKITRILYGQIMKYNYVKTVKSMDELDKFRFKV